MTIHHISLSINLFTQQTLLLMENANYLKKWGIVFMLCLAPLWAMAQSTLVKGAVKDTKGEPIIGASIVEKGTTNGMLSDLDGNFSIKVRQNATLVISYIGYVTQEVPTRGRTSINVTLNEDTKNLQEVVVIGYGTQRKEAVTGSVASMRGDLMRQVPGADITNALQGRIAGVDMTQTSSKPGATMQIRIRGTRSLNASNDPLVVLDGIPFAGSISDIDPNNIKSMDILKDASATAIYGSRGANGVILVTTYRGMKEQKAKVTYNMYVGLKTLFARYPMMNGEQFVKLRKYANKFTNGLDESDDVNTDWQDLMFKNSMVTNHDIGLSNGNETGSYNVGVSLYRDEALVPKQNYNRYSMRFSLDQEIGKYVKVGLSTNTSYAITNGANLGLYSTLSTTPISNPYNDDGTTKKIVKSSNDDTYVMTRDVINSLGDKWKDCTKAFGTYNSFYGEVKIPGIDGLKYRLNVGLNYRHSDGGSYTGEGVFSSTDSPSSASQSKSTTTNWAVENLLTYDKTFGKSQINVTALYSSEQTKYTSSYVTALGIPNDAFQYYNLGQATGEIAVPPASQGYYKSGLESWMGRVMYSYDDKYMASVTLRSDGSSRLASGHKWHTYPAISVGWNIAKESFMSGIKWIDNLKLRFGYGETSNQSVNPYKTLGLLSTRAYNYGSTTAVGYYVSELPNSELGWEYSRTYNAGLDFSMFKGRLTGTFEYYVTNTRDLLLSVNLPATSGVSSYMANVGRTQNKGFELSLNGTIIENLNGWSWDVGINLYSNHNELKELASGSKRDEANWWFVGHPINVIYDYKKVGLWQADEAAAMAIAEPSGNAGMIKVQYNGDYDANGLPTRAYGPDDRQIIKVDPDWEGGFNTRVAYKNWDLSMVGAFKHGGTIISTLYGSSGYLNMLSGRRNNVDVDYWTEDNTDAKFPKPGGIMSNDNPKYGTTLGYFSGSYLKVRTITLGYNFNQAWMKAVGISSLRVYATVQNPFVLFSPYKDESGMDPETNSYGNENQAVGSTYQSRLAVIGTNTPSTRNYLIGLNVTF